jgi:hypothetical protein
MALEWVALLVVWVAVFVWLRFRSGRANRSKQQASEQGHQSHQVNVGRLSLVYPAIALSAGAS